MLTLERLEFTLFKPPLLVGGNENSSYVDDAVSVTPYFVLVDDSCKLGGSNRLPFAIWSVWA